MKYEKNGRGYYLRSVFIFTNYYARINIYF